MRRGLFPLVFALTTATTAVCRRTATLSVSAVGATRTMATSTSATAVRVSAFGEPDVMNVEDVELGDPGAGEVLVEVHAVGVNPVDTYIRSGAYANKPALPYTPGHDAAGVVKAVGAGVDHVKVGDRVFTARSRSGAYATAGLFDASRVSALPDSVSFLQGAALGTPYATAFRALFQRGGAAPGRTVLVHGASGAVGLAAVQLCKWKGITVFGTAGTDAGLATVRDHGAAHVFNHRAGSVVDAVVAATGGGGVDVIVEMLANENLGADLTMLAKGGNVAVVGCRGEATINPRLLMGKEASVSGVMLGGATDEEWRDIFAGLRDAFAAGATPVVGATFHGLESAPAAHVEVIARSSGLPGKVVIDLEASTK